MEDIILDIPKGYEFFGIDDNNKVVLKPIQPQYSKTYEECSDILGTYTGPDIDGYKHELLWVFQKLLICRDAYWKLAGDWEPDWTDTNSKKFIICSTQGKLERYSSVINSALLSFPTAEMRDAFYENFKELINDCKELL